MLPEKNPEKKLYSYIWLRKQSGPFHLFFCHHCQNPLFQYKGYVTRMIPGTNIEVEAEEIMKYPLVIRCRNKSPRLGKCPMVFVIEQYLESV